MLSTSQNHTRSLCWRQSSAPTGSLPRRPGITAQPRDRIGAHPLSRHGENAELYAYEQRVKAAFDGIVPVLKSISALQHEAGFERQAQRIAGDTLGFELPESILADAWVDRLDMPRLFAYAVFRAYQRFCDEFISADPLGSGDESELRSFFQDCGFHAFDISPCSDGRLSHVIRYVLRLPYRAVRRKSYAGSLFDVEDNIEKWVETEMLRFREGRTNDSRAPTRYLKAVVYHFSSGDPENEGCAAHGSDTVRAAAAGLERLTAFQEAIQNSFCCGAAIDLLLIGVDTDTDVIRVHVPDQGGIIDPAESLDAAVLFAETEAMAMRQAEDHVAERVRLAAPSTAAGMQRLVTRLLINNFSQIEYVRAYHGGRYEDVGHAERFIGAGIGFEEAQLRNLSYIAYMNTVEEAAADLDVGVKIFSKLNVAHGLPVPVVVRFDYHGHVPGARERAIVRCRRVREALEARYRSLADRGLLHTLMVIRDCAANGRIEVLGSSVSPMANEEAA